MTDGRICSRWAPYVTTVRYLALFALVCFFLMPVYALVVTALKSPGEVSVVRMWEWPQTFSLDNFRIVWPKLADGFLNSVLMALPASLVSSILGAANGFVLSKWRFPPIYPGYRAYFTTSPPIWNIEFSTCPAAQSSVPTVT